MTKANRFLQRRALGSVSGAAILCTLMGGLAAPALAADEVGASEDIVVTARKRAEDIQRVPIAVTALTAADLTARNISNFNDLSNTTPGISITSIAGGTAQNIYIRGLAPANTANDLNVEANVGVFIDGIYQTSRNTLDMISVLDIEQIEIAKGPQSALFGRSTFAGAVSINTAQPTDTLKFSGQATVGNDKDFRLRAAVSAPITDTLSVRVAGGWLTYDGFGKNAANPDDNLNGTEKWAITGAVLWQPTDELTVKLAGFITHSESDMSAVSLTPLSEYNCGTTNVATGLPTLYCGTLPANRTSDITPNMPKTVAENKQASLDISWSRDGIAFTSVTGFTASENSTFNDYDGTSQGTLFGICSLGVACLPAGPYNRLQKANLQSISLEMVRTFSQEFRIQSDGSSPFSWITGASYFNSRIPLAAGGIAVDNSGLGVNDRLVQVTQVATPAPTGFGAYEFTGNPFLASDYLNNGLSGSYSASFTRNFSIFGAVGYDFGTIRVNAEGRYNSDQKQAQVFSVSNPLSQPGVNKHIVAGEVPAAGVFPVVGPKFRDTFTHFAPRFTVDWQAMDDLFVYASAAKGYRSGGFNTANPVSPTGILADEVAYQEESNWTYELGFKSNFWENRVMLNASVFHVDWSNAQVSGFTQNPTAVNPVRIVRNAGDIKANGFEVQAEVQPVEMFSFGGSLVYSDPKFQKGAYEGSQITQCVIGTGATATAAPGCPPILLIKNANGATVAVPSLEGLRPQRSVKLQWNLHATVDVPITDEWKASGRVDVTHTGESYSNLINTSAMGERTLTNLRVGFSNDRFDISAWVNNLFDVTYVANSINQPRAGVPFAFSIGENYLGETRRFGLTASFKY
ncbi:TonB-dependent receptor [Sandaracinobacteroides hominis]|uniref:TonB-dependent receptor n=1 Tax=Sandaracinobacteroides hominis TaxID=2780086 RepID=UPI0018F33DFE|nr:TonB-dependent receptor [Sandaracinobacteroides hominis]